MSHPWEKNQILPCNDSELMGGKVKDESKRMSRDVSSPNETRFDVIVMLWFIFTPEFTIGRLCVPMTANIARAGNFGENAVTHSWDEVQFGWNIVAICVIIVALYFLSVVVFFLICFPFRLINSVYCNVTRTVHCLVVFVVVTCARDVMPYSGSFVLYFGVVCRGSVVLSHTIWVFVFAACCLRPDATVCAWGAVRASAHQRQASSRVPFFKWLSLNFIMCGFIVVWQKERHSFFMFSHR